MQTNRCGGVAAVSAAATRRSDSNAGKAMTTPAAFRNDRRVRPYADITGTSFKGEIRSKPSGCKYIEGPASPPESFNVRLAGE
jgi:hypothetical protein